MKRFAAAALMDSGGRILLGRRGADRAFYPGVWDFIGGHCREGESFEAALCRELREELGIEPTAYRSLYLADRSPDFIFQLFLVKGWEGSIANRAPEEHEAIAWFGIAEARLLSLPEPEYAMLLDALATAAG